MSISDVVQVTIQTETAGTPRAGFGVPLILSPHTLNADRVRTYDSLADLVADGFSTTGPEYLMATALLAQTPKPSSFKIGRLANRPVPSIRLVPTAQNSTTYTVGINATSASFTSDSSATVAEITAGLETAIDALAVSGLVTTDNGTSLDLTGAAGVWFSVGVTAEMSTRLQVSNLTPDPGYAADLAAIAVVDNDWYGMLNFYNSKVNVEAIATYAEANEKLFIAQTQDTAIINTTESGTDDVAESLESSARMRTALIWHEAGNKFADAAWAGRLLPTDPGSETWHLKNLSGPTAVAMTSTQRTNGKNKNVTLYYTLGASAKTFGGKVSGGEWIDVIRFRDWLKNGIQTEVFNVLSRNDKVPFTDAGIAAIKAAVLKVLAEGVEVGGLVEDPAPKCTAPKAADVSSGNKALRNLPDVKFDAVLAGAIHITSITGTLSVS